MERPCDCASTKAFILSYASFAYSSVNIQITRLLYKLKWYAKCNVSWYTFSCFFIYKYDCKWFNLTLYFENYFSEIKNIIFQRSSKVLKRIYLSSGYWFNVDIMQSAMSYLIIFENFNTKSSKYFLCTDCSGELKQRFA